jgi:hypothetical protein
MAKKHAPKPAINQVHSRRITTITDEEAIQVLQWLRRVGDGDAPDAANGRIVEVLTRGMNAVYEQEHAA